jgi:4-hydroxybenzoate polyprenyltransferase
LRQNIFEAHRLHFYQILSNEKGVSHLKVSFLYAFVQAVICAGIIFVYQQIPQYKWWIVAGIILILIGIYSIKFKKR